MLDQPTPDQPTSNRGEDDAQSTITQTSERPSEVLPHEQMDDAALLLIVHRDGTSSMWAADRISAGSLAHGLRRTARSLEAQAEQERRDARRVETVTPSGDHL